MEKRSQTTMRKRASLGNKVPKVSELSPRCDQLMSHLLKPLSIYRNSQTILGSTHLLILVNYGVLGIYPSYPTYFKYVTGMNIGVVKSSIIENLHDGSEIGTVYKFVKDERMLTMYEDGSVTSLIFEVANEFASAPSQYKEVLQLAQENIQCRKVYAYVANLGNDAGIDEIERSISQKYNKSSKERRYRRLVREMHTVVNSRFRLGHDHEDFCICGIDLYNVLFYGNNDTRSYFVYDAFKYDIIMKNQSSAERIKFGPMLLFRITLGNVYYYYSSILDYDNRVSYQGGFIICDDVKVKIANRKYVVRDDVKVKVASWHISMAVLVWELAKVRMIGRDKAKCDRMVRDMANLYDRDDIFGAIKELVPGEGRKTLIMKRATSTDITRVVIT